MKIVICPDSFKGCLTAKEVTTIIAEAIHEKIPDASILQIPLADGGEGTGVILKENFFPEEKVIVTQDAAGKELKTKYFCDPSHKVAFVESADIIGLPILKKEERNPLKTTSFGLGEVIKNILKEGYKEITVSLGGSATCDGGIGMMNALSGVDFNSCKFKVICDVTNPLLGPNGCVKIFAPQKGAQPKDLPILENRLKCFVKNLKRNNLCKNEDLYKEGSGAAGGLGFAFQTLLKAETYKGIDYIFKAINYDKLIQNTDIIITGEGKIDSQSLMGKVVSGVLQKGKSLNIPVIAVCGLAENIEELHKAGLSEIYQVSNNRLSLEENMIKEIAINNLRNSVKTMLKNNTFQQFAN